MSGKIRLGKTADSRSRRKLKVEEETEKVLQLKEELKHQSSFTDYLLKKGFSTSTVKRYVKDAGSFTKWVKKENIPLENVSYADVLHYVQSIRNRVKQRTISGNVNSIKHYFNFLFCTEQTIENPTTHIRIRGIKRRILYDILSKKELESLYHNFEVPSENPGPGSGRAYKDRNQNWYQTSILVGRRNKVILGLIVYQGLGSQELGRLMEKDLKLREGKIYIAGSRRSNERELTLEAHQVMDLMEYVLKTRNRILELTGKQSEKLFVSAGESSHFRSIMVRLIHKLNKQSSKACSEQSRIITSAKQIRASVITHWLKNHNLRKAQYMAGHRYVSSTEAYLINDLDDLSEEINKYHPLADGASAKSSR